MSQPVGDDLTHRDQLIGMVQAQPEMLPLAIDDIVGPPLPPDAVHAWRVFSELSGTRSSGMGGVGAITYSEMLAYQTLTDTSMTPLDVALVREADHAFLRFAMQRMKRAEEDAPDAMGAGQTHDTEA